MSRDRSRSPQHGDAIFLRKTNCFFILLTIILCAADRRAGGQKVCFFSEYMCFLFGRCVESTRTDPCYPPIYFLPMPPEASSKKLWNQRPSLRPASVLGLVAAMCRETQWIHTGGWALESRSNNDSKSLLPDSVGTKRDASGWVWGFFISTKATSGRMALDDEDAAEMTRRRSDIFGESRSSSLPLRADIHRNSMAPTRKMDGAARGCSRQREIPAKSLLAVASN